MENYIDIPDLQAILEKASKQDLWTIIIDWDRSHSENQASKQLLLTGMNCAVLVMCTHHGYTLQTLEKEFRERKISTWIGANPLMPGYGLTRIKEDDAEPIYCMMIHMGSENYCLNMINQIWDSYEENFTALSKTGLLCISDET